MAVVTLAVKYNFFLVPKDIWEFEESSKWPKHWQGNVNMELKNNNKKKLKLCFLVSIHSISFFFNTV